MNWLNIEQQIKDSVKVGDKLDRDSKYRKVVDGPDFPCSRDDYAGKLGYNVQIGKSDWLQIPFILLKTVYEDTLANNGIYNRNVICKNFNHLVEKKGCHVHVVGRIFVHAGIMEKKGERAYQIIAT